MIIRSQKTNFNAGEIDPRGRGRDDLSAYDNGAARLRNVWVNPLGGVFRRAGLRYALDLPGDARLLAFEFNTEQVYLLAFLNEEMRVYLDGSLQTTLSTPWINDQIKQLVFTQSADTLLVTHQDVQPRKITRSSHTSWTMQTWIFYEEESGRIQEPHYKFANEDVTLQSNGLTGTKVFTCSEEYFTTEYIGLHIRMGGKEVEITDVPNGGSGVDGVKYSTFAGSIIETLDASAATRDWTEPVFSSLWGWPVSVCFHQSRMAIGGSRSLPNRLWMSKTADLFNFDLGDGDPDDAIELPVLSDQVNAIRHVVSSTQLEVFTSGAEWYLAGQPGIEPTKVELKRQTRVGVPINRSVPPINVDGVTVFVPRNATGLKMYTYSDVEQRYSAPDLALVSSHLLPKPIDMDYDGSKRLLHVVNDDGSLATLTVYRDEKVSAWTLCQTDGLFRSVAVIDGEVWCVINRDAGYSLEVFDEDFNTDAALSGSASEPKSTWSGLDHLEGRTVRVVADGADAGEFLVSGGSFTLPFPASTVEAGLPYAHIVEPLPPTLPAEKQKASRRLRPLRVEFLVRDTSSIRVDRGVGRGAQPVPLRRLETGILDAALPRYSGEVSVNLYGWREDNVTPLWRIVDDTPMPFFLLAVRVELSLNQ